MCGRFSLFVPRSKLEDRFEIEIPEEMPPRYNIAPKNRVLAVRNDQPDTSDRLQWGFIPHWVDDPDEYSQPINARAETVDEKPFFRDAFENRRCLILADGFYEWAGDRGSKEPYRIERVDSEPFAFAGLWESWESNGDSIRTCSILTTEPNNTVAPIHDRMPVLLEPQEEQQWLEDDDGGSLKQLLDPYPDDDLTAYRISTAINNPDNENPGVVEPVDDPQSGLGEFA
jgi:putative SOS response-associated peptidase YedK